MATRGEGRAVTEFWFGAALLLGLAALAAALLIPALQSSGDPVYRDALERARSGLAASELATSPVAERVQLEQALTEVEAALERNPLASEALDLRTQIERRLAALQLVRTPTNLRTLVDLASYGPTLATGVLRWGGNTLYALDDAGGRVFAIEPDGTERVIFDARAPLNESGTLATGRPISMFWSEALWILDDRAQLFRWTAQTILLTPLPDLSRLGSANAVAATATAVYILDASGGAIWRYAIDPTTLALSRPVRVIERTDLDTAVELSLRVDEEGRVELLAATSDGRLRRFLEGSERPVAVAGLDRELLAPASLTASETGLWYAADRGAGRILALRPAVGVVAQIEAEALSEVRGIALDESRGLVYYALPEAILVSPLPRGGG